MSDPWRHKILPEEVLDKAKALPIYELQALVTEVNSACASMSMRSQDKSLSNEERGAALRALRWTLKKKAALKALATRVNGEGFDHKRERVETMIETAEASRLLAAAMRAMWNME